jgi:hypothetical protein
MPTHDVMANLYFDKHGALIRVFDHFTGVDIPSANGKVLTGLPITDNVEWILENGEGTHEFSHGMMEKVILPDGTLFFSVGWLDVMLFSAQGGFVTVDRGLSGDVAAFCAALAP